MSLVRDGRRSYLLFGHMSDFTSSPKGPGSNVFSLTQIRHLMRVEFGRAQRYGYALSCMVVGCDRLERLRDIYGYALKETVLEDVVELLRGATRNCDYLGRMLDERLMGILPHTDPAGARTAGERLLKAARSLQFDAGGNEIRVTLSIGLATFAEQNTMFFDSLVQAAERAYAKAAREGGDRLLVGNPAPAGGKGPEGAAS